MNIKLTSLINLLVVVIVLAIIFYTMSPRTNDGISSFSEMTFIVLGVFLVVTIIRMVIAARRKK